MYYLNRFEFIECLFIKDVLLIFSRRHARTNADEGFLSAWICVSLRLIFFSHTEPLSYRIQKHQIPGLGVFGADGQDFHLVSLPPEIQAAVVSERHFKTQ